MSKKDKGNQRAEKPVKVMSGKMAKKLRKEKKAAKVAKV